MPIYEYHCEDCQQLFEHWQKTYDPQETIDCPICKGTGHKVISNTSFVLKGGGWYVTDYGNRKNDGTKEAASSDGTVAADAAPAAAAPVSSSGNSAAGTAASATSTAASPAKAATPAPSPASSPAAGSASSSASQV